MKNSPALVNCTGIVGNNNLLNNNQIRIYPNPTNGKILIQNLSNITIEKILVRNVLGDIILLSNNINLPFSLDLSNVENGIYFIEITSSKGKRIEKVILSQ